MQNQKGNTSLVISFIIVIAFIGLIVYTLATPRPQSNLQNQLSNQNQNNLMDQNTNTNSEKTAQKGDALIVNYTGRLEDGTVFDSNVDPKFGHVKSFKFIIGTGNVIQGWEEGFIGMKVGEKRTLTIPPEKGYGSQAIGVIPPNSTLIFDVELVGIN